MSRQAGFVMVGFAVVSTVIATVLIGLWIMTGGWDSGPFSGVSRMMDGIGGTSNFRIVYTKDGSVYSIKSDGTGRISLDGYKINNQVLTNGSALESQDGQWLFIATDNEVWRLKTDGSRKDVLVTYPSDLLKQRGDCSEGGCDGPYMELFAASAMGDEVLLKVHIPAGEEYQSVSKYDGTFIISAATKKMTPLSKDVSESTIWYQFDGKDVIYSDGQSNQFYRVKPDGNVSPVPNVSLDDWAGRSFIDFKTKEVVYETGSTGFYPTSQSYSVIGFRHFGDARRTDLSPEGDWAEYQCLSVSPQFSHVVYCHQYYRLGKFLEDDMYYVDLPGTKVNAFVGYPCSRASEVWINENMFVCSADGSGRLLKLYTYSFRSGKFTPLVSDVSFLVPTK